jgi:hypothetical protein
MRVKMRRGGAGAEMMILHESHFFLKSRLFLKVCNEHLLFPYYSVKSKAISRTILKDKKYS